MSHKSHHSEDSNKKDVSEVFQEFADGTSMHGVPHIINARSMIGRLIWSIVCIWAFGMFLWQCGGLLERFFSYPKKVNVEIVQSPIPFPAVSVCNTDFMDIEVANAAQSKSQDLNTSQTLLAALTKSELSFVEEYDSFIRNISAVIYLYNSLNISKDKVEMEYLTSLTTRYSLVANFGYNLSSAGSVKLGQFVASCQFMNQKCNASSSFSRFFDPYYFNCYTFEPERIMGNRSTRLQGVEYGLTLILSSVASAGEVTGVDFAVGMQEVHLALASERGARLIVHTPGTRPNPTADGYDIPTSYSVTLGVKARQNVRISHPHGNCTQVKDQPVQSDPNIERHNRFRYTLSDCQNKCIQRMIMEKCKCMDNRISQVENPLGLPFCLKIPPLPALCVTQFWDLPGNVDCKTPLKMLKERIECQNSVHENMTRTNPEAMQQCNCYPPCEDTVYDTSYSLSSLPQESPAHSSFFKEINAYLATLSNRTKDILEVTHGGDYEQNLKKNMIRLNVHISDSNIIKTIESPDYEPIRLVSDIGGQLGLWIGISVMTIFEMFQLVADIMRFLMRKSCQAPQVDSKSDKMPKANKRIGNSIDGKPQNNGYFRANNPAYGHIYDEPCEIDKLTTV